MRLASPLAVALLVALLAAGCDKARPYPAAPSGQTGCTGCHGGFDNTSGAPPRGIHGELDNAGPFTEPGQNPLAVGAHSPHLAAGVACEECHKVPTRTGDPGHIVLPSGAADPDPHAEIDMLHGRGALDGATPSWNPATDRTTGTCSNVYCHGATRNAGGGATLPTWNDGQLPGAACSACHASPPASHGAIDPSTCASCHPQTVTAGNPPAIIAGGAHVNGQVEVDFTAACTVCHGDALRVETVPLNTAAPPLDLGRQSSSDQVGAHLAHLHDGPLAKAMACAECHVVPSSMAHAQGGQPKVAFATETGTIARNDGASPGWTTGTLTCSGVYCHGATIGGGSNPSPTWIGGPAAVGIGGATATARCGACHGFPPPAPHTQQGAGGPFAAATECATCHPGTVDAASGGILVSQGLHVNGQVEANRHHATGYADPAVHGPAALADLNGCRACHGATLDGALGPSCTSCHASAGHPTWKTECIFCHGNPNRASFGGFALVGQPPFAQDQAAPPFGTQGESTSSQVAVGAHQAHLNPAGLSRSIGCQECHGASLPSDEAHANAIVALGWGPVARADGVTPAPAAFDAAWEASPTCTTYCHGASLGGGTRTTPTWTGTGQATCGSCHALRPGSWHPNNSTCGQCHATSGGGLFDPALHVNGTVDLTAALTCTSCHGTAGANAAPPVSTSGSSSGVQVGAHQAHLTPTRLITTGVIGCDACHPAASGLHHANDVVELAWSALASVGGTPTPAAGGLPAGWETTPNCTNYCHGATLPGGAASKAVSWTGAASVVACGTCHFIANPPATHPAVDSLGAPITAATQCGQCHTETVHPDGSIDLILGKHINGQVEGGGHQAGYSNPAVHGPAALADIASCTSCHGTAYDGAGDAAKNCNACHANPASYGLTGYAGSPSWKTDCTFCHGSTTRLADATFPLVGAPAKRANLAGPPTAPGGATSGVAVGAHLAHYDATANLLSTPLICTQCHGSALPTDLAHLTGTVTVAWGALATAGGTVPPTPASGIIPAGWESSPTCTNYCHGATLAGGALKVPGWTAGLAASACSACHGDPMPYAAMSGSRGFHPPNATCASCHTGYTASVVQRTTHVNGTVEVVTLSCHTCHGDLTSDAPGPGPDTTGGSNAARVGAHQAHTSGRVYSAGFGGNASCGECHGFAPTSIRHANARTEIGWVGIVATAGTPTINGDPSSPTFITPGAAATCANYCHGATLPGGAASKAVTWSGGPTAVACGTCHFIASPPAPHPGTDTLGAAITSATQCSQCHPGTVNADGTIARAGGLHVNGQLDGGGGHAAGYSSPAVHGPDALASITSCQACHGAAYDGGGTASMNCNACHANPSGHGLPAYTGSLDWQHDCTFCHGDAVRAPDLGFPLVGGASVAVRQNLAGPPLAPDGSGTGVDVGAHLAHFDAATNALSSPFQCSQCHGTSTPSDLSHVTGTVATGWGPVATAGGTTPTPTTFTVGWEASPTCTNYCHGATLAGGTLKQPSWIGGATASACTACHGAPPNTAMSGGRGFHPPNATCGSCHPGSTASAPVKAAHVNGTVEKITLTCHSCHGGATSDAPPTDTTGGSVAARVGAHQAHVAGRVYSDGLGGNGSCSQCHGALPTATTHANGSINIGWGTIARTNFATPTPNVTSVAPGSAITCTNFCHNVRTASGGATGGTKATITWTETLSACISCHAIPSSGGSHTSPNDHEVACSVCHPAGYTSTAVNPALHVNGTREVTATGWNSANRSCGNNGGGCHGADTKGPW